MRWLKNMLYTCRRSTDPAPKSNPQHPNSEAKPSAGDRPPAISDETVAILKECSLLMSSGKDRYGLPLRRGERDRLIEQNSALLIRDAHFAVEHPDIQIGTAAIEALSCLSVRGYKVKATPSLNELVDALGRVALGTDENNAGCAMRILYDFRKDMETRSQLLRVRSTIEETGRSQFEAVQRISAAILEQFLEKQYMPIAGCPECHHAARKPTDVEITAVRSDRGSGECYNWSGSYSCPHCKRTLSVWFSTRTRDWQKEAGHIFISVDYREGTVSYVMEDCPICKTKWAVARFEDREGRQTRTCLRCNAG